MTRLPSAQLCLSLTSLMGCTTAADKGGGGDGSDATLEGIVLSADEHILDPGVFF